VYVQLLYDYPAYGPSFGSHLTLLVNKNSRATSRRGTFKFDQLEEQGIPYQSYYDSKPKDKTTMRLRDVEVYNFASLGRHLERYYIFSRR